MTSNFHQLPKEWQYLTDSAVKAEKYIHSDPSYAALLCRKSLEEWVRWMYEHDEDLELPGYDDTLSNLMHARDFKDIIAPRFFTQLNIIRKLGNDAAHTNKNIKADEALHALKILHGFVFWVANIYRDTDERIVTPLFDTNLLPKNSETSKPKIDLRQLEDIFNSQQEKLAKVEAELARYKAQKTAHINTVSTPIDPNEALTRKLYIDLLLNEAGWDLTKANVIEYPLNSCMLQADGSLTNGRADYVLWGDDGLPLAVVEAKRTTKDAEDGRMQGERYAKALQRDFGQMPIIFFTNGFETYLYDYANYAPRLVHGFYTKDELQTLVNRRSSKLTLHKQTINDDIADRYYQQAAIRAVGEVLEKKHRGALLVMATGTGKTRVAAAIIDLLSKANWVKRVLFLADRNALIDQAKANLNQYLPNLPSIDLTREKEDDSSRIVFSTYQTLINLIDGECDGDNRFYGVGHFDLIIFDEIHRSVYNKYKAIFDYFDGYHLGLTATPKSESDRDTYALFELPQGDPTYAYELEQAVSDGFLVPPKAIEVPIKFQRDGIKYADLSEEEKLQYEEQFADPITGIYPDEIDATALNGWLFNTDTVDKAINHLIQNGIKVDSGDKLAKTIIFARSHAHAKFIKERFDLQYPEYCGTFLRTIDYQEPDRVQLLNDFKDKTKQPQIAVSVDMLDTGIDVPEVCNLVFFKPVRSSSKYWQMIGRGTRLCPDLFALGEHKQEFIIFDLCANFDFFRQYPEGVKTSSAKRLSQRLFELRIKLSAVLTATNDEDNITYAKKLKAITITQTKALNQENFAVRQHWRIVEKYCNECNWDILSDSDIRELFEHIAPLVMETEQDEGAKIFDLKIMQLQLSLVEGSTQQESQINTIKMIANNLSKKTSIPAVNQKIELLRALQTEEFWQSVSVTGLEKVREEIRELIKFLEREAKPIIYSTFEDEFSGETKAHDILATSRFDLSLYKKKIEQYLKQNEKHLTIYKLRHNQAVTIAEINELERMLFEQGDHGTKEQFIQAYGEQPLGRFVRSIMGMEANAAKQAFAGILNNASFNSRQISFINEIINSFIHQGIVEPERLFKPPFTEIHSGGIFELFGSEKSVEIINLIQQVNNTADVA